MPSPTQTSNRTYVEQNEHPQQPKVAPAVGPLDVEAAQEKLVRRAECAVQARTARVRVRDVPARGIDERPEERGARLARGRVDLRELDGGAVDGLPADRLAEQSLDEVCVRREAVHPPPPAELAEGLQDAVAVRCVSEDGGKEEEGTYKGTTNEKKKLKRIAAISVLGDIAATACERL